MDNEMYSKFKKSGIWKVVDGAISDLVANQDLQEKTSREHIVGYICKKIIGNSSKKA